MQNPYLPIKSRLVEVITESPTIKTFIVEPETPVAFEAGQFVELTLPALGEAPFTPSSSPVDKERMALTVMRAGRVTAGLHETQAGAELGVRGPYGNAYPLGEYEGKDILVLGGGVGLAPLRSLVLSILAVWERFGRIILCYGARTPSDMIYRGEIEKWRGNGAMEVHLTVDAGDDGWKGKVGVVTTVLEDVEVDTSGAIGVVCGPPIMMKFGTLALIKEGFAPESIYLSMERNMSCGIGKCGHCRVGPYYVCKDGPVFTYAPLGKIEDLW